MLKSLPTGPDGADGDDGLANAESENRMRRALEALSRDPRRDPGAGPQPGTGEQPGFRPQRRDAPTGRDGRVEAGRHDMRHDTGQAGNRGRHRFIKDGEVPVVHMAVPRPRDAAAPQAGSRDPELPRLQALIDEQRHRAEAAERALAEAQAQMRAMQTRFAHLEMKMADADALAAARAQEVATLQEQLRAANAGHEEVQREVTRLEARLQEARQPAAAPAPRVTTRRAVAVVPDVAGVEAEVEDAATAGVAAEAEQPEPVQWWLVPSRTVTRRPRRARAD